MTQPAITQQIRILEEKLHTQLFDRRNKKMVLTPSGLIFLRHTLNILKEYHDAKQQLGDMAGHSSQTLRIATIYSIGLYDIQSMIKKFLKDFPQTNLQLEYHSFEKIYSMTAAGEVDFGFVAFPTPKKELVSEVFAVDDLVLVQSPHYPVFRKTRITLTDLHGAKFVTFMSNMPTRKAIDAFFDRHHCTPKIVNEYDNVETLKSAAILGIGCALLPRNTVHRELLENELELIPVRRLALKRPMGILYIKGKKFSSTHQFFLNMFVKGPVKKPS